MENPNDNQNNLDLNEEIVKLENEKNDIDTDNDLEAVEFRIQEVEILIDQKEQEYFASNSEEVYNEYVALKEEYKSLMKKRKQLMKSNAKQDQSVLEQVSMWVVIYGVLLIILSLPILTGQLWLGFADKVISLITNSSLGLSSEDFIYKVLVFMVIFAFPLLLNLITWIVHNNCLKRKADKKVFRICWIISGVMCLGMIIYMCTKLYA